MYVLRSLCPVRHGPRPENFARRHLARTFSFALICSPCGKTAVFRTRLIIVTLLANGLLSKPSPFTLVLAFRQA